MNSNFRVYVVIAAFALAIAGAGGYFYYSRYYLQTHPNTANHSQQPPAQSAVPKDQQAEMVRQQIEGIGSIEKLTAVPHGRSPGAPER